MKLKGSKSTQLIKSKELLEKRLNEITSIANDRTIELQKLKSKITQSKPLLETIYQKVKLKEDYLEAELIHTQRKLVLAQSKPTKESKANLETLRMVKKLAMFNNQDHSYFNKSHNSTSHLPSNSKQLLEDLRQRREREERKDHIEQEMGSPPKPIRAQHTYNEYQQRLQKARGNNERDVDRDSSNGLKQKLREVSKELKSGIDIIKKVRQEFRGVESQFLQNKTVRSEKRLKPSRVIGRSDSPPSIIDPQKAMRFLQNKQRRLDEHRRK